MWTCTYTFLMIFPMVFNPGMSTIPARTEIRTEFGGQYPTYQKCLDAQIKYQWYTRDTETRQLLGVSCSRTDHQ